MTEAILLQHICDSLERLDAKIDKVQEDVSELKEKEAEAKGKNSAWIIVGSTSLAVASAIAANYQAIITFLKGIG